MNDKEIKAIGMCRLLLNGDITLHVIDDDGGTAYAGTVNKTYNDDLETVLNLIEKQKAEIEEYKAILDIGNNRKYRKKYLEERRKEEPNLLYPDADEIYERYYKQKEEIEKLNSIVKIDDIISKVNAEVMEELRVEIKTQKERIEYLKRSIDRKEDSLIEEYQNNVELETKL